MTFNSLTSLLRKIQQQPSWEPQNQFQRVLQVWPQVMDSDLVAQARPIAVRRRVLWVATANAVIAQNLTLGRHQCLQKLNTYLTSPLLDIRYSPGYWYQRSPKTDLKPFTPTSSSLGDRLISLPERPSPQTPLEAFQRWQQAIELRREVLPLCPQCQGPTRPQDLERWQMCGTCASRHWQS